MQPLQHVPLLPLPLLVQDPEAGREGDVALVSIAALLRAQHPQLVPGNCPHRGQAIFSQRRGVLAIRRD